MYLLFIICENLLYLTDFFVLTFFLQTESLDLYVNVHCGISLIFPCLFARIYYDSPLTYVFLSSESTTQDNCLPTQLLVVAEIHSETTNEPSKL